MRIVIAEDSAVVRAGLVEILADRGHEVVAAVGNAEDLRAAVDEHQPDATVVDVRMPPGYTDEGLRAAIAVRRDHPKTGVLVFSQYIETRYAADLLGAASGGGAAGVGYLLKDRVADVSEFVEALSRVAAGGTALDPEVVTQLLGASRRTDGLGSLTARERDVLALMAKGGPTARSPGFSWSRSEPSRSTSGTSSASSAWHRRTPITAGCWPCCAIWSPDQPWTPVSRRDRPRYRLRLDLPRRGSRPGADQARRHHRGRG